MYIYVPFDHAVGSSMSAREAVWKQLNLAHVSLEIRHAWPVAFFEVNKKPS